MPGRKFKKKKKGSFKASTKNNERLTKIIRKAHDISTIFLAVTPAPTPRSWVNLALGGGGQKGWSPFWEGRIGNFLCALLSLSTEIKCTT